MYTRPIKLTATEVHTTTVGLSSGPKKISSS
jgi:hypothetical protein